MKTNFYAISRLAYAGLAAALMSVPAFADVSAGGSTGSDILGGNLKFDVKKGSLRVRDAEAHLEVSKTTDTSGASGLTVSGSLRKLWYVGGEINDSKMEYDAGGFYFEPGVNLRLDFDRNKELRRHDLDVTAVGAYRYHWVSKEGKRELKGEELREVQRAYEASLIRLTRAEEEYAAAHQALDNKLEELNHRFAESVFLSREVEEESYRQLPKEAKPEQDALANARNRLLATREAHRKLLSSFVIDSANRVTHAVTADSTGEVRAPSLSYMRRHNKTLGVEQDAALLEAVMLGGHVAKRINGVNVDFCGELSPGGLAIGDFDTPAGEMRAAYRLRAMACMGASVGPAGRIRFQGDYELLASVASKVNGDSYKKEGIAFQNLRGTVALDRIFDLPLEVHGYVERESLHTDSFPGNGSHTVIGVGVKAAY